MTHTEHSAGKPVDGVQRCKICGCILHAGSVNSLFFPTGSVYVSVSEKRNTRTASARKDENTAYKKCKLHDNRKN